MNAGTEFIVALAAVILGAGLYMWLPEGHKKWGIALTIAGVFLFIYAGYLVLFPRTFAIDIAQLQLKSADQFGGLDAEFRRGSFAVAVVHVENRGEQNSLVNWRFSAETPDGNHYDSTYFAIPSGQSFTFYMKDPAHPSGGDFSLDSSQQIIVETEKPLVNGAWENGVAIFHFENVLIDALRQPGTRFVLTCTEVLNHQTLETDFRWTGVQTPYLKYPGLRYLPVKP